MALTEGKKTETPEYVKMLQRMLRAYARRVTEDCGDIEALAGLVDLSAELEITMARAIAGLVASGHSWAEIGRVLGVTRQAAQQRYSRLQARTEVGAA